MDKEQCKKLFDKLPIGIPIILHFKKPYKDVEVIVSSKLQTSEYCFSFISLNKKLTVGESFWIQPSYLYSWQNHNIARKLISW